MPNTGALFVAVPAADDPVNSFSKEDQAHITLTWFGEAEGLDGNLQIELMETLDDIAKTVGPFTVQVSGTAVVGPDKAGVLLVESEELVKVRNLLIESSAVRQAQANAERQFPWWLPHLTVSYDSPVPSDYPESIQIDRLGFWAAGDKAYASLEAASDAGVTAGSCCPPIWDEDDLALGVRVASLHPAVRWYVQRRAKALGLIEKIPTTWSME